MHADSSFDLRVGCEWVFSHHLVVTNLPGFLITVDLLLFVSLQLFLPTPRLSHHFDEQDAQLPVELL